MANEKIPIAPAGRNPIPRSDVSDLAAALMRENFDAAAIAREWWPAEAIEKTSGEA